MATRYSKRNLQIENSEEDSSIVLTFKKNRTLPDTLNNQRFDKIDETNYSLPTVSLPIDAKVFYVTTIEQCNCCCSEILRLSVGGWSVWGFDLEWRAFSKNGPGKVALLQLSRENVIILFQISQCGLQSSLIDVLSSKNIFKVGLNIAGDVAKLQRDFLKVRDKISGIVDLRDLSRAVDITPATSLAGMVEKMLHQTLLKPNSIRMGNWEKYPLDSNQQEYAALDAYATYIIFKTIFENSTIKTVENDIPFISLLSHEKLARIYTLLQQCDQKRIIADTNDSTDINLNVYGYQTNADINYSSKDTINIPNGNLQTPIAIDSPLTTSSNINGFDSSAKFTESVYTEIKELQTDNKIITTNYVLHDLSEQSSKLLDKYDRIIESKPQYKPLSSSSSKSTCHQLWMAGNTFQSIANKRGIKETTVVNYILNIVKEGGSYDFRHFHFTKINRNLIVSAHIEYYLSHAAKITPPAISSNSNSIDAANEVDTFSVATTTTTTTTTEDPNTALLRNNNIDILNVTDIQKVFQKYNFISVPCYWHIKMIQMHLERNLGNNWLRNLIDIEKKYCDLNKCTSTILPTTPLALGAVIDRECIEEFLS